MKEQHPFGNFYRKDSEVLIIGSFPCFNGNNYGDWYYSGSGRNDFWKLLSEVFNTNIKTKQEKQNLCIKNKIAITDIGKLIERKKNNCSDSNLKIIEHNKHGIEECLTTEIELILFTSKFVKTHFEKLFPNIALKTSILPSPSPSANRYFASIDEYKKQRNNNEISSVYEYKLNKYKELLQ